MDFRTVYTTCSYCGCGCGMLLEVLDDEIVGTLPVKTHPVSEGSLCIKGWNIHEFIESERRLTKPLMRKDGKLVPVSWDEALDLIVEKFAMANMAWRMTLELVVGGLVGAAMGWGLDRLFGTLPLAIGFFGSDRFSSGGVFGAACRLLSNITLAGD